MNSAAFDWSQRRILVVEDDPETLARLRTLFASVKVAGLELVADGSEALPVLRRFPADLVLIEANPKGMDGLDLLRAIRNREASPNPDVLVAVMIMGLFVFKIRDAFESIDADDMTVLKG